MFAQQSSHVRTSWDISQRFLYFYIFTISNFQKNDTYDKIWPCTVTLNKPYLFFVPRTNCPPVAVDAPYIHVFTVSMKQRDGGGAQWLFGQKRWLWELRMPPCGKVTRIPTLQLGRALFQTIVNISRNCLSKFRARLVCS